VDAASLTEALPTVALAVALAACAGLRAWLPLLLASALSRTGWLQLGDSFQFLASNKALFVLAIATSLELLGDKIPAVDHTLDMLGTVIRPAAGALLAASVLGHVSDPLTAVVMGAALGAPAALVPHAAKSVLRAASTTLTAGLANPVLSVLEDAFTLMLFALAVLVPLVVIALLAVMLYLMARRFARARTTAPNA
jgi:Domain of unknown function (DUF4126)